MVGTRPCISHLFQVKLLRRLLRSATAGTGYRPLSGLRTSMDGRGVQTGAVEGTRELGAWRGVARLGFDAANIQKCADNDFYL